MSKTEERMPLPPTYLYKYRSLVGSQREYTKEIFETGALFWPSADMLNDPFDCFPAVTDRESKLKREIAQRRLIRANTRGTPRFVRKHIERSAAARRRSDVEREVSAGQHAMRRSLGVCSLTEVPDDILMWSHYADYHRGICLQFRTTNSLQVHFGLAFPIQYSRQRPTIETSDRGEGIDLFKRVALTKADHWSYEKEWRLVDQKNVGNHTFPRVDLTGVILGAAISAEDEAAVRMWATPFVGDGFYKAALHPLEFRLVIDGLGAHPGSQ